MPEERTYTQTQLNAIIGKALAEERLKLKAEFEPRERELAQREQELKDREQHTKRNVDYSAQQRVTGA